ncbi:MAG: SAM-dependent methyltransferase [Prevotella sp.]|nr:SAM-dependent methyltransferase [Prevotella sp.]
MTSALEKQYCSEQLSAREAQRLAQFIAWGPVVFQVGRIMLKWGLLEALRQAPDEGLTRQQLCLKSGRSDYAVKCLLEASLSIGLVLTDKAAERFTLSKTGWFLLNDEATRVNLDFVHDVNYEGMFHLEEALEQGMPAGLRHFGSWPTIYEGLSSLPQQVQDSWFGFDHYYSDSSFDQALQIVLGNDARPVRTLYDVGGNTGRWALQCVAFSPQVRVTVVDLPQQLAMMQQNISGKPGAERISAYAANVLSDQAMLPESTPDAIWMSQFLDCFSMEQITAILLKARRVMSADSRLYIMETLWDRQRFETATLCLTMTSLYFAAMANGNSKMYNTADMEQCISEAGLEIETIHDHLGLGHSLIVARKKQ